MNRFVPLALAVVLAGVLHAQTDVFAKLGSNETEAREQIFSAFSTDGFVPHGASAVFKAAGAELRVAMVTSVVAFARAYTGTADFAARYARFRNQQKPEPPAAAMTVDQMNAESRKGIEAAIADAQKMARETPSMKKAFDEMVTELRKQLAEVGKDAELNAQTAEVLAQQAAAEAEAHAQALAQWEKEYPADPRAMVAARLKAFLELSATVDYAAKTAPDKDKRLRFVNEAHEAQGQQWKMMYRAGRPAVDAARAAAQEWLKALGG